MRLLAAQFFGDGGTLRRAARRLCVNLFKTTASGEKDTHNQKKSMIRYSLSSAQKILSQVVYPPVKDFIVPLFKAVFYDPA